MRQPSSNASDSQLDEIQWAVGGMVAMVALPSIRPSRHVVATGCNIDKAGVVVGGGEVIIGIVAQPFRGPTNVSYLGHCVFVL